ncbi:MAG: YceI family protein [Azonexus sp.]
MKQLISALLFATALPLAAQAVEYTQVQTAQSSINFAYKQMGVSMDGKFRKFAAQLNFDPAKPTLAKTTLDVDLTSIDTGAEEADQEVAGKQWFNTKAFPTARFVSSGVKALGGNRYEVAGKLSIKGRTLDIVAPVTFTTQGNQALFAGSFSFKRADFAIGEGSWAAFDTVANEIQVKFQIIATPGK